MREPSRRQLLGVLGTSVGVALAGCGADIQEGEFVVVDTRYKQHPDADTDVKAQVEIENRRSEEARGTLSATLEYAPEDGESQTWTEQREIEMAKGISRTYDLRFSNVVSGTFDREQYSADATLEEPDDSPEQGDA